MTSPLHDDLWHRDRWTVPPADPEPRLFDLTVLVAVLAVWNLAANTFDSPGGGIAISVAFAGLLVVVGHRRGLTLNDMGLDSTRLPRGLSVGLRAVALVLLAVVVAALIPVTREFFADDRFIGVAPLDAAYELFVRIPIATALAEEIAFRGVLLGLLLLWLAPLRAVVVASLLFGLWHVLPALDAIDTNPAGELARGPVAITAGVAAQVVVTSLVGLWFSWLRLRGSHVLAPALAHWAVNGAAYAAGWVIVRNAWA